MLPSAKRTLAGTYFAEQVSVASYDLVCISHAERMNRPGTQQSTSGGSSGSRPGTQSGIRRRQAAGAKVACTELPSLNSIELLLDPGDVRAAHNAQSARDAKQEVRDRHDTHVRQISARLCRGEVLKGRSEDRVTPSDMDVVASLTQPLAHFTRQLGSPRRPQTVSCFSGGVRRHDTYQEVVEAALAGTELHNRRRKPKHPTLGRHSPKAKQQHTASTGTLRSNHSTRSLEIIEVNVLPENAAEAYLRSEALAEADQRWQAQEAEAASLEKEDRGRKHRESLVQALGSGGEDSDETQALRQHLQRYPTGFGDALTGRQSSIVGDAVSVASSCAKNTSPLHATIAAEAAPSPGTAAPSPGSSPLHASVAAEAVSPEHNEQAQDVKLASGDASWNEEVNEKVDPNDRNANILEAIPPAGKMSTMRREASQSLRTFIFGGITEKHKTLSPKDIDRALREKVGTKAQVQLLYTFWGKLDDDKSGSVDIKEFKLFVDHAMKDITDGHSKVRSAFAISAFKDGSAEENATLARQLCDRVGQALLGRKSIFVVEDLMRIIWPCSRSQDIKLMKGWVNEFELTTWRTSTPKQLPKEEFDSLAAVFRFFDDDGSGSVTIDELIHSGLMDKEQAHKIVMEADGPDGDGELQMLEFCELFCPTGFRAHSKAKVGTDEQGRRVVFDDRMSGWRLEEMDPGKAGLFS